MANVPSQGNESPDGRAGGAGAVGPGFDLNAAFADAQKRQQAGDLAQAEWLFRTILQFAPTHAPSIHFLGVGVFQQGRTEEGLELVKRSLELAPDEVIFNVNRFVMLGLAGRTDEAIAAASRMIERDPNFVKAHMFIADTMFKLGRNNEAVEAYERVLAIEPNQLDVQNTLTHALRLAGKLDRQADTLRQKARAEPNNVDPHVRLGAVLMELDELEQAIDCCHKALDLQPGLIVAHGLLGMALQRLGRLDEGLAHIDKFLASEPADAGANFIRAWLLLQMGRFEEGWPQYEWRWKFGVDRRANCGRPRWDGGDLGGRTILVNCEQGLGDAIQFARFVPLVARRGAKVIFECLPPLVRLAGTIRGVDRVLAEGQAPPPFDVHCPLHSVPGLLGTTMASIPRDVPYLRPDAADVAAWARRIGRDGRLRVGIVWTVNPQSNTARWRRISPQQFMPIVRTGGAAFYSLQVDAPADELASLTQAGVGDLAPHLADFAQTAAAMCNLDLIVTVDTAVAHLAGALGRDVWVLLPFIADWRWFVGRDDSPWYPTMRLFRQGRIGDWEDVIARVSEALAQRVARPPATVQREKPEPGEIAQPRAAVPQAQALPQGAGPTTDASLAKSRFALLRAAGKADEALAAALRALELDPTFVDGHLFVAGAMLGRKQFDQAADAFARALAIQPNLPDGRNWLAYALRMAGKRPQAADVLRQMVHDEPSNAGLHSNLGTVLMELGELEQAQASCRRALELKPDLAEAHSNLGSVLFGLKKFDEAIPSLRRAVEIKPDSAEVWHMLGCALWQVERLQEARDAMAQAIARRPGYVEAHTNLGLVLRQMGMLDESLEKYDQAMAIAPSDVLVHFSRGVLLLQLGRFEEGWREYEWRWKYDVRDGRADCGRPRWDGGDLGGRTILLNCEQGMGDVIQFLRYAPLVARRGGKVIVECQAPLVGLARTTPGVDFVLPEGQAPPPFDVHCPFLSLPGLFGTTAANIPRDVPYFHPDAADLAAWAARLAGDGRLRVGLAW